MFETVTVDEAIAKGQRMVNYPAAAIMLGIIGLSFFLLFLKYISFIAIGVPAAFILAWLYWSFAITKWRLWAFENVRNVHELQMRALEAKLIWKAGSFGEKTEIRTAADKARWAALQYKFEKPDVFTDDITVPSETMIYYTKISITINAIIIAGFLAMSIALLVHHSLFGWPGIPLVIYMIYDTYKNHKRSALKEPQIILNAKGIAVQKVGFYEWKDIRNDRVIARKVGKAMMNFLEYNHPRGKVKLQLMSYNIKKKTLIHLLHTYRARSEKRSASPFKKQLI